MQLLYIGQTDNFKRRMSEHRGNLEHDMHRYGPVYVEAEVVRDETTRCMKERALINSHQPPCNRC
jgi:predicted GIY-YIG superfamily endonuclease